MPVLILRRSLDRQESSELNLLLMVIDGGKMEQTGLAQTQITILDVNNNTSEFHRPVNKVRLLENVPNVPTRIPLNASNLDKGLNR